MARIVELEQLPDFPRPRYYRYPWAEWCDSTWREVDMAAEYPGRAPASFASAIWAHAKRRGLLHEAHCHGDRVFFWIGLTPPGGH